MKRMLCTWLVLLGSAVPCLAGQQVVLPATPDETSLQELYLMRNEISARHGKPFKESDLNTYFRSQDWYKLDLAYDDSTLSRSEKASAQAIKEKERQLLKQNYLTKNEKRGINFGNVINRWQFGRFSEEDIEKLSTNGFLVVPARYEQLFHVYEDNDYKGVPSFVTTDAVLQLYHIFFNFTLRNLETEKLIPTLRTLTDEMVRISRERYDGTTEERMREAARRNLAYFTVAGYFLAGDSLKIEPSVSDIVRKELEKCEKTRARENSLIFNPEANPDIKHDLDYTQFIPRGHYTRSEELKRYFRAMMWFGLNYFLLGRETDLLQSLAITQELYENGAGDKRLIDLWDEIYEPTSFYVGLADDLTPGDYWELMHRVFGDELKPEDLADASKLATFEKLAAEVWAKKCKIRPQLVRIPAGAQFRFMGQRYIPDSEILQRLSIWPQRPFPKGLDVMAVLGSREAKTILLEDYKEGERWAGYPDTLEALIKEFGELTPADWGKNLYYGWVWCLKALAEPSKEFTYPFFMQARAWELKSLNTSLASWAELRHDTILYGKQSGAECGNGQEWYPDPPKGYVEPNVLFYRRMGELLSLSRAGLDKRGLITERIDEKFKRFMELVSFLENVSLKELANQPLTNQEYEQIKIIGALLENLTISVMVDEEVGSWYEIISDVDKNVAVIADVHTSLDSVLEEGVGPAFEIYTIVEIDGCLRLTRGAVLSYYEFTHPASDRLTDEKWQRMLKENRQPRLPHWTGEYLSNQPAHDVPRPKYVYSSGC